MINGTHPFARAGYPAPYKFIGAHQKVYQACVGAPIQSAGSCDVCGTCYTFGASFRAADGRVFDTGLVCAAKSVRDYDAALAEELVAARRVMVARVAEERRAVSRAAREAARAAERAAKEQLEADVVRTAFDEQAVERLEAIAHPMDWRAEKGDSWADAVRYHLQSGNFRRAMAVLEDGLQAIFEGKAEPRIVLPTIAATAKHIGTVGQRIEIRGRLLALITFETAYGVGSIVKLVTDDGDLVAAKTSSWRAYETAAGDMMVGQAVAIKATVKSHDADAYNNGAPVTWIQRPTRLK